MSPTRHIPAHPGELSPEWVTSAMRAAGTIGGDVEVVGLHLEPLGDGGVGLAGETVRVSLTYRGPADAVDGSAGDGHRQVPDHASQPTGA